MEFAHSRGVESKFLLQWPLGCGRKGNSGYGFAGGSVGLSATAFN
jgi:hypothetical protein